MASIKLILRSDKTDGTGEAPLFMRIIKDRKAKFMSIGLKFKPSEWDEEKQRVKKNHSNSARMNAFITSKIAEAEGQMADLQRKKKDVSAKKLKEAILGKAPENYFEFVYNRLEKTKPFTKYGCWSLYLNNTKKLESFVGSRDFYFDDITVSFLNDYKEWMANKRKNNPTTIAYNFKIMRKFFREAIREDVVAPSLYPFDKFTISAPLPVKHFLSKEQLEALKNLEVKSTTNASVHRDMFVFACYAGGLRFADVIELQWQNFKEEEQRIVKPIRKTGRLHQFKLPTVAMEILKKYRKAGAQPTDFIFPILPDNPEYMQNGEYHYKKKLAALHTANNNLHTFGKQIKLPFTLTFHASRHTFATQALNNGMRIEFVSKLMDHCNIGITQVYAKIIDKELDAAVEMYMN